MVRHGRIILLVVALMFLVGGASAYLAGYGYYQDATINNTGSNLTNYQVMFVVNTSSGTSSSTTLYLNSHSEADLDDLRFTDTSDNIYPYWIENASSPYTVWVNVTSISTGNSTVRVQYGNASASGVSNITTTMIFGDDFEDGTINTALWTVGNGVTEHDGVIHVNVTTNLGGTFLGIRSKITINPSTGYYIIEGRGVVLTDDATKTQDWFNPIKIRYNDGASSAAFVTDNQGNKDTYMYANGGAINPHFTDWVFGTPFNIKMIINAGSITMYKDSETPSTVSYTVNQNHTIEFTKGDGGEASGYNNNIKMDTLFVRLYTATVPTIPAWSGESTTCTAVTPVAAFSANTTSGYAPLSVLFTDASTNTPTSWAWSWGDATANGTTQNPNHTYSTGGTYNVTLTATNCAGSDGETKLAYISVYELVAFPGCAAVPTDLDADGLYEDINGNTRKDWSDIILFFKYRIWAAANEPPDAFDWNSNGIIDYKDVLMLYDEGV